MAHATHVILFEHVDFQGIHKHVFGKDDNLTTGDNFMNDKTSSFVILQGNWQFFKNADFNTQLGPTLGPGQYSNITSALALGPGSNDKVSSLKSV